MGNAQPGGYYFAPPSHWPIVGSSALLIMAVGGLLAASDRRYRVSVPARREVAEATA